MKEKTLYTCEDCKTDPITVTLIDQNDNKATYKK